MFLLKGDETAGSRVLYAGVLSFFETQKGISVEARPGALIFYRGPQPRPNRLKMKDLLNQAYHIFGFMVGPNGVSNSELGIGNAESRLR